MEKLGCWTIFFIHSISHTGTKKHVYADRKLHDLQSRGTTEKPQKVLQNLGDRAKYFI